MTLLLLLQVLVARPALTPGAARPTTREAVCAQPYVIDLGLPVDQTLWRSVLLRYEIPWERRYDYTPDWLIPTSLGGLHVAQNLWPALKASDWNAARKALVARAVYADLCRGRLHLLEAQQKAGTGWIDSYRTYFAR